MELRPSLHERVNQRGGNEEDAPAPEEGSLGTCSCKSLPSYTSNSGFRSSRSHSLPL